MMLRHLALMISLLMASQITVKRHSTLAWKVLAGPTRLTKHPWMAQGTEAPRTTTS